MELYYTNTYKIEQTQSLDNIYGYSLPLGNVCIPKVRKMEISSGEYRDIIHPINLLASISSETVFQVLSAKVKFYYWLELETEAKTLEVNIDVDPKFVTNLDLNLNQNTLFDYVNNKVVLDPMGITGFYLPKFSHGYYELELNILQDNNTNKFLIKNLFNFNNYANKPYVSIGHIWIDSLDGFKEAKFDD